MEVLQVEGSCELPELRGPLANDIPFHAIEQANQGVLQDNRHSQHVSNQVSLRNAQ